MLDGKILDLHANLDKNFVEDNSKKVKIFYDKIYSLKKSIKKFKL